MHHHEDLSARDVPLLGCSLIGFRLFNLLAEEVRISRNALHKRREEQGIKPDEAARLSEVCKRCLRLLTLYSPPVGLCAEARSRGDGI